MTCAQGDVNVAQTAALFEAGPKNAAGFKIVGTLNGKKSCCTATGKDNYCNLSASSPAAV
jgi:hypothetical protein